MRYYTCSNLFHSMSSSVLTVLLKTENNIFGCMLSNVLIVLLKTENFVCAGALYKYTRPAARPGGGGERTQYKSRTNRELYC